MAFFFLRRVGSNARAGSIRVHVLAGHAQVALGSTCPQNTCGGGIKRRVSSDARAGSIRVHVLAGHVPLLRVHVPTEHVWRRYKATCRQ